MAPSMWLILLGVAALAGLINSVASGGSLLTYPALLFAGLSPIVATATVLLALMPANASAVLGFGAEVREVRPHLPFVVALVGGGSAAGTALLYWLGASGFEPLVPWFILFATALFALGPTLRTLSERTKPGAASGPTSVALFGTAIYAGFFGSGAGNIFLGLLAIRGHTQFLNANVIKNVILVVTNVVASIVYAVLGLIAWEAALPVLVGSLVGGAAGGSMARQVPLGALRIFVIGFGLVAATCAFVRV